MPKPRTFAKSVTFDASKGVFVLEEMPPAHQWVVDLLALAFGYEAIRIPLAEDLGQRQVIGVLLDEGPVGLKIRDDVEGYDINHDPQLVLDWIKSVQPERETKDANAED